jgi:stage II sporulation protein M
MTKVISLRKIHKTKIDIPQKISKVINSDIIKFIYLIISVVSILFGCIVYTTNYNKYITSICNDFITKIQSCTYLEIFVEYIKIDIIFFIFMFFLGTSIVGTPLTIIPLIVKNSFFGYLSSYMYNVYDLKGILFSLVLLYPLFIITTASLIYAANESVYMSKYISNTLRKRNTADNISIRLYLLRYAVLFGINVICIASNSFLVVTLANKINLH